MRTLLILFFSSALGCLGQVAVYHDTVAVYAEKPIHAGLQSLTIPVDFNQAQLKSRIPSELKNLTIQQIDLVYTLYHEAEDFDQKVLNEARIAQLKSAWPEVNNDLIQWRSVGQSQANDATTARTLFHGFVVYYRPKPTEASIQAELAQIDEFLSGSGPAKAKRDTEVRVPSSPTEEFSSVTAVAEIAEEKDSCLVSKEGSFRGTEQEFKAFRDSVDRKHPEHLSRWEWTWQREEHKKVHDFDYSFCSYPSTSVGFSMMMGSWFDDKEYDAVRTTFERHPNWKNSLVVMDVTGSMSGYIAKTMAWVKATQNNSQVQAFTFFNDGDAQGDRDKRVGHVGGIYGTANASFEAVYQRMQLAMNAGGGGDCPENNVEATMKAMREFPEVDEIVMVADNWASPRDLSLTYELERPVHVIVCGSSYGINVDYLQLAYETKGSVHTIEEDLEMRDITPGKQFRLGKSYFTLVNGKIVRAQQK